MNWDCYKGTEMLLWNSDDYEWVFVAQIDPNKGITFLTIEDGTKRLCIRSEDRRYIYDWNYITKCIEIGFMDYSDFDKNSKFMARRFEFMPSQLICAFE